MRPISLPALFRSVLLIPVLFLGTATLAGCNTVSSVVEAPFGFLAAPKVVRGNKLDPDVVKELVVGVSTRTDAQSLLGTPTAKASFEENTWLYITETTQSRVGRMPAVLDQNVVALTFDDGGVLRGVKTTGAEEARDIDMVARATPSPGTEASFLQQLLGNVGRFTPGSGRNTAPTRDRL